MRPFLLILLSLGLLWLRSSLSKFISGNFVSSLGDVLSKTAAKNPYPLFKQFLITIAIPNSQVFGSLVLWGEFLTALAIIFGSASLLLRPKAVRLQSFILIAGLVGGLFLNITFWLGFGYTSPSTDSLNLLMTAIEIIGGIAFLKKFWL